MKTHMITILVSALALLTTQAAFAQQAAKVPSNFDLTPWVVPTENMPGPNYPRVWGDFPNPCSYANLRYDDPIQYPGKFNASPLNVFFGNTLANANSTYDSLRKIGESTCWGGPVNRSSIYMPAMITADGKVVLPELLDVVYRGDERTQAFPRGLKMMMGPKYMDSSYQWDANSPRYAWSFGGPGQWWGRSYNSWIYQNFSPNLYPDYAFQNTAYRQLIRVVSPDCWDGVNLDSADHYSHLAYSGPDATMTANCPTTHPVKIPQTLITVAYTWMNRTDAQGWYLSSDRFGVKFEAPGTNFYVGFIPAWDDDIEQIWVTKILNQKWFGAFSKIGDGRILSQPPTTKIFGPTQNLGPGRDPRFLWSLSGLFWMPGGYVPIANQRVSPPAP